MKKMAEKKHDVLGNILQGSFHEESLPIIDELTSMLERYSKPLISREKLSVPHKKITSTGQKKEHKSPVKKRTTHYLTKNVYSELDVANNFLRGLLPPGSKLLSTKSKIVEYAVKMMLEDFDSKGEKSQLAEKLLKDKNK